MSQGCWRQSAALARFAGMYSIMGSRKALNYVACSRGHSYFSMRTSYRPQCLRLWMCLSSPAGGPVGLRLGSAGKASALPQFQNPRFLLYPLRPGDPSLLDPTSPVEELPGVAAGEGEGWGDISQKLHNVSNVVCGQRGGWEATRRPEDPKARPRACLPYPHHDCSLLQSEAQTGSHQWPARRPASGRR